MEYKDNIMTEMLSPTMVKEKDTTAKVKISLDDIVHSLWDIVPKPMHDKAVCHHLFGRYYRINVFKSNTYGSSMVGSYFTRINDNSHVDKVLAD